MKKFTLLSALFVLFAVNVNAADSKEECMNKKTLAIRNKVLKDCGIESGFEYDKLSQEDKNCLNEKTKEREDEFKSIAQECGME